MAAAAFTFGSVGDIIAICQLVNELRKALTGSAKEYQDLRDDLDSFQDLLNHVVATYMGREHSRWLQGLDDTTKSIVERCMSAMVDMLSRIQPKYDRSLGRGQSSAPSRWIKGSCRKVQWSLTMREPVQDLRHLLDKSLKGLTLLVAIATQTSNQVDHATLLARVAVIEKQLHDAQAHDLEMARTLRELSACQGRQEQQLIGIRTELGTITRAGTHFLGYLHLIFTGICDVKDSMGQLTEAIVRFQISAPRPSLSPSLDPTKEMPVILEDSLERTFEIPAKWIEKMEWRTLHNLIDDQFKDDTRRYKMVQDKGYALEENASGRDLDQRAPLSFSLKRGMKINMSMLFVSYQDDIEVSGACPGCGLVSQAVKTCATVQCQMEGCGMTFQIRWSTANLLHQNPDPLRGPRANSGNGLSNKTGEKIEVLITPANFQRVRMFLVRLQERRRLKGGWFCCCCKMGPLNWDIDDRCWDCAHWNCLKFKQDGYTGCTRSKR